MPSAPAGGLPSGGALAHHLLNRAEGDNSAIPLLGLHFKTQKASVVAGDGRANDFTDRRGFRGTLADFYFIDRAEPEAIATTLVEMVKTRIPAKFRIDPIRDIQVLCPMNRGSLRSW
jgi:hypothetical protein